MDQSLGLTVDGDDVFFLASLSTGLAGAPINSAVRAALLLAINSPTLLDWAAGAGRATHAVGKIGDIFSMRGIGKLWKGQNDLALFDHLDHLMAHAEPGSLIFANFVEFDSLYGHPRDVAGYARALEAFDARVGALLPRLKSGDLVIFTADHGNDPTWRGTDHTRERVPVLGAGQGLRAVGLRAFADVAATVAAHLDLPEHGAGVSFL